MGEGEQGSPELQPHPETLTEKSRNFSQEEKRWLERNLIGLGTLGAIAGATSASLLAASGHYEIAFIPGLAGVAATIGTWLRGRELVRLEKQIRDNPSQVQKPEEK
jgi:hypothetical protein